MSNFSIQNFVFSFQALFSLLGVAFVQKHFPHHKFEPEIIDHLEYEKREKIIKEMKEFIDDKVTASLERYQYHLGPTCLPGFDAQTTSEASPQTGENDRLDPAQRDVGVT